MNRQDLIRRLVKDTGVIEAAYNDAAGVTAEFNRNLLSVLNAGLEADFDPEAFEHYAYFNQDDSRVEMHLRPRTPQVAHLRKIGLMEKEELSEQQLLMLEQKRAEAEAAYSSRKPASAPASNDETGYPASAKLCNKCNTKAVVVMDSCATCLSCGYSKCG